MTAAISRRALLAGAGLVVAGAGLGACGGSSGARGVRAGARTTPAPLPRSPYLSGNYGPVEREVTATDLTVTGRLPVALSGYFVRNGPNPISPPTGPYSWFGGDGMLHVVELDAGRARSYRNRWVRTPRVARALGEPVPAGPTPATGVDLSNTSTARLGSTLLSLTEGALPYVVDPDGSTVGRTDLGGALTHGLSAHAKYDPSSGEVHQIGYSTVSRPYAVWQVIDARGQVTRTVPLDLPEPVMIHTTTLTPGHVLVYDLPVVFDVGLFAQGWSVPFRWDPAHQARLGVIDRTTGAMTWIDLPPLFVFHDAGSHDTSTGLVVDLVTYPRVFATDLGGPLGEPNRLERWTVDAVAGTVHRAVLDDRPQEFPRVAPGAFGRANRFTYAVAADRGDLATAFGPGNAVVRHDHLGGTSTRWSPGPGRSSAEAVFVPDPDRPGIEDGGWLLAFVHDAATDGSEFVVLDASDLAAGPVATVALPQRVPAGFHGNWFSTV